MRLVGGAALSLRYFDRRATHDLDLVHVNPDVDGRVAAAAERVAARRGWSLDWLNFAVNRTGGVPAYGRDAEWVTIHDRAGIVIQVASKETLLAMKLRANRPGRDTRDVRLLLALCGLATIAEVERRADRPRGAHRRDDPRGRGIGSADPATPARALSRYSTPSSSAIVEVTMAAASSVVRPSSRTKAAHAA